MDPNEALPEPTLPSAEQMRAQRLARMQQSSGTSTPQQSNTPQPMAAQSPQPASPAVRPTPPPERTETHQTGKRALTEATPEPRAPKHPPQSDSIETWSDRVLSSAFRVTLDPNKSTDLHGRKVTFLPGLREELESRDEPLLLTADYLDSAILEAATARPHTEPLLDYLLPCFKNVVKATKQLRAGQADRLAVLQEAKRLAMSNCIFALTMPDFFGRENPDALAPYLLRGLGRDDGICLDFMSEAVSRMEEDESVTEVLVKAMIDISQRLSKLTMNDSYQPHIQALVIYTKFKPLVIALARRPEFQMALSAPHIERMTLLGPFFRISPLQMEVAGVYFASPRTMDAGKVRGAQGALQMTLMTHQDDLLNIVMSFARADDHSRQRLLEWFAYAMNVNHKRRAIQVNPKEVASDGFMMNVTAVLDRMCEPFMDTKFDRMERIDIDYFRRKPKVDIKEETKLNADQAQSDAFYATTAAGETNFVSELFFLTLAAHHYGSGAAQSKLKNMDRDIKYFEKQLADLQGQLQKVLGTPQAPVLEGHVRRYEDVLNKHVSSKHALEGVLLDEKMQTRSLLFMRIVSVWLLRVASQSDYRPDRQLQLPLPREQPEAFRCLPEYALQDVVDSFKFIFRNVPRIIISAVGDELITLCVTFLESSEYIRNPYLKSSLVSLLFAGTWQIYHKTNGVLGDALSSSKFANDYLLHALMKFYIECESTGANSAFYDKFNIRYEIFQVIKCVWPNNVYKQQLTKQSQVNRSFFVQFVNLLLNDATFVLDEALSKFPKIHELQIALNDNTLSAEDRQAKETELQQTESAAQSYMQLANETVAMMKLFTNALGDAFTMPEIVNRLAGMLDYNLEVLAGSKSRLLKVENATKYHFNPKVLLPEVIDIYLNLAGKSSFIEAVARDGRSYKAATFDAASRILGTKNLVSSEKLVAWDALKARFAVAKEEVDQAELEFGEIPAEFEDPILGELMRDPVLLPSHNVVDRSTITQHLLSDPKDPFTRQPMTIDDVVPMVELREKIEAWKQERLAAARAKSDNGGGDAMDTS